MNYSRQPHIMEKLIAALTYLTAGWIGFIWLIISLLTKKQLTHFLRYHIYQSIFIAIGYYVVSFLLNAILHILSFIPFVNVLISTITYWLSVSIFGISIIGLVIYALILYLSVLAFLGKYSYLPYISNIIRQNVG